MTVLTLAPSILVMMTSFTRIIVVFHFLRSALGTTTQPPNQLLTGLALFLTFFVMQPVLNEANNKGLQPYLNEQITQQQAIDNMVTPFREFMLKHTREQDLGLFIKLSGAEKPKSIDEVSTWTIIPAFSISELRMAFQIGFLIFIPFLVLDMIIASTLMSLGMFLLPPQLISLPIKILLFILVDGWYLIIDSLMRGIIGQ
jgi:flagellar biosynthetic protein FliP